MSEKHVLFRTLAAIWILLGITADCMVTTHWQRYDGWYNNLVHPSWGSADSAFSRKTPVAYADGVYKMAGVDRPNPRLLSDAIFKGRDGLPSSLNRTAMFAFFGQVVAYEIMHGMDKTCPIEVFNVPMTSCDKDGACAPEAGNGMPVSRIKYAAQTGESMNNPRAQLNRMTSWIDGSYVYSVHESWAAALRRHDNGTLLSTMHGKYPAYNDVGMPVNNYLAPHLGRKVPATETYRLGEARANQHPGLLAFSILFFRYHNSIADRLRSENPAMVDEDVYMKARRMVVATMQSIFLYEYLPALLNEPTDEYKGYDTDIYPGVTTEFHAAAFRYGHTHIPPGFYLRDSMCRFRPNPIRLCNTYFDASAAIKMYGIEEVLMGMASQIAEKEDTILIDDLREYVWGPSEFSRRDLVALNIMRGRDTGLADYNSARVAFKLPRMKEFTEINPTLNATNPEMFDKMRELYISVDDIDLYVGGMMETTRNGPGPLFRAIIRDQFYRIRDGDRFWFENKKNKLFTADEINTIRNTRLRDVILAATPIGHDEIQDDVLFWQDGDMKGCPQPKQLTEEDMEPCTGRTTHDNFDGNEASYIISCIILGIIPIICGVAAYIVVKYRVEKTATIKKDAQQKPAARTTAEERAAECMSDVSTDKFKCREWLSSFYDRKVTLRLDPGESFFVLNRKCERLRQINLNNAYNIILEINVDTQDQVVTLVRLPRDHDLVLLFSGERKRKVFLSHFNEYLKRQGKSMEVLQSELHRIYDTAETKDKRVKRLECFFREAYARAMGIKMNASVPIDPVAEDDVMRTEVTKSEFADALGMKSNSLFVERIFAVTDKDGNGQISFQEFLDMVVLFTKGTPLNKLRILFDMFDVSRDGKLGRQEFAEMIRSLVQSTQTQFARRDDADHLIDTMMTSAGLGEQAELTFDEFRCLLHQHGKLLGHIGLHLKGTKQVFVMKKLGTRTDSFKIEDGNVFHVEVKRSLIKKKWNAFITFMEDNRQKVFYLTLFYCICLALFAERYAHYCVLSENNDLRRVMGHGICVTRGAAHVMSFTFSLLLLTVCRHIITALRDTVINQYIPLDSALEFHKIVACTSAFFTAVHSVGHIINMYHVTTQPIEHLMCLFKEITFPSTFQPNFVYFLYKTVTGLTGLILVAICYILFIFATPVVRLRAFKAFWLTHHLYIPIYVLMIVHGSAKMLERPLFYYYVLGPAILFVLDKLITVGRRKVELNLVTAELLPSDVTKIVFARPPSFQYRSGQWLRICCPAVAADEFHSFTITSAPHENTLSVHVKALGRWTWKLRKFVDPANMCKVSYPKVIIDGPYGGGNQEWYKYDVAVMIGGGIGITPYSSILSDLVYGTSTNRYHGVACKKVYFLWICPTHRSWEWFIDVLRNVEERDVMNVIDVNIFVTQYFHTFDLRTMMLYICEQHFQSSTKRSMFTGLKAKNHFGRPDFEQIFKFVRAKHPEMNKIGVFSCGPPILTHGIDRACAIVNQTRQLPSFLHFYENF